MDVDAVEEIVKIEPSTASPEASNQSEYGLKSASSKVCRSFGSPPRRIKKQKVVPKSLSVSTILQLGKLVPTKATLIKLYSFNFESLTWSMVPVPVEFVLCPDVLGEGGFRKAYKATTTTKDLSHSTWVVKRYKPEAVAEIEKINQTVEGQTRKVVQMHHLAKNFAESISKKVMDGDLLEVFGETLKYKSICLGEMPDGEYVSVEEFVDGTFTKYINNDGIICEDEVEELVHKAECLTHYSYIQSKKQVMVLDIQGVRFNLFDPEIASTVLMSESEVMFAAGNLSVIAIENFTSGHKCNKYCRYLDLESI